MNLLVATTCLVLMLLVGAIVARNLLRRSYDLLSWRNLFLLGYFHFVLLSGFFTVTSGLGAIRRGAVTSATMALYSMCALAFLVLFLLSARWAFNRVRLVRLIPPIRVPATTPGVLAAIGALLLCALLSLALRSGYTALLAVNLRGGMAAAAAGLATFYLLASRFNPVSWVVFVVTVASAIVISTVGGIGRREVLAVLIGVPWMWYFMSLRYRSAASIATMIGGAMVAGMIALTLFTSIRFKGVDESGGRVPTASDRVAQFTELLSNPSVGGKVVESMLYTDTANVTMWIMDNYPSSYPYTPLHAAYWVLVNPVPRSIFPEKPEALGIILAKQMNRQENLGPGVLGQGWSEGGWLGVIGYALFLGALYGLMDRALFERAWNPFFVAVMAAGAGNVLAMPRGDVALFFIQIMAAMVGSGAVLLIVGLLVGPVARAFPPLAVKLPRRQQLFGSTYSLDEPEEPDPTEEQDPGALPEPG